MTFRNLNYTIGYSTFGFPPGLLPMLIPAKGLRSTSNQTASACGLHRSPLPLGAEELSDFNQSPDRAFAFYNCYNRIQVLNL